MEKIWYNTPNGKQYKMNVLKVGEGRLHMGGYKERKNMDSMFELRTYTYSGT